MIPTGPHKDWLWPFKYIPRRWTAWESTKHPKKLLGNASWTSHLDITQIGTWAVCWPPYLTFHLRSKWHFRIGYRYDYVDMYYTFVPFTLKKIN